VLENSSNQSMEEQEITDDKTDTVLKNSSNQPMEEQEITDDKTGTVLENSSNQSMEEKQVIETEVVKIPKQPLFGILPRRLEEHYYQPYQSHPVDLSTSLRDVINIITFFKNFNFSYLFFKSFRATKSTSFHHQ